jgi:dienelactone hydrolase
MRVSMPADDGRYPVVVLSHGGGSSKDGYTRVADHWASHGYVVIAPTHKDSKTLGFDVATAGGRAMADVTASRMKDLTFIAKNLAAIAARVPGLAARADGTRMVAAGHSMGGGTALTATGLRMKNKRDGSIVAMDNPGFVALILLSETGHNPMMPDEPWRQVKVPTFISTGTNDAGAMTDGTRSPFGYDFDGPAAFDNPARHYLWIDGVDHYMGGLWCCEGSKGPPDTVALRAFNGATTAFLDAYAKNDNKALRFLMAADLKPVTAGRATLSLK